MSGLIRRYANWLHLRWPAGAVERLPEVGSDGATVIPGVFVAGDLTGVPLLKFALDSGVRSVRAIAAGLRRPTGGARAARETGGADSARAGGEDTLDLVILGAGVSGLAAAIEAHALGLSFEIIEASEPLSTLLNFPRAKPIYTYPMAMRPAGALQVSATLKESLIEELRAQVATAGLAVRTGHALAIERDGEARAVRLADGDTLRARAVLVAIGRSGEFRRLGVPGESRAQVFNRLHDPADFRDRRVVVVGGGDSALEAAIALAGAGATVTLVHRGESLARPKRGNLERLDALTERTGPAAGRIHLRLSAHVRGIGERDVTLEPARGATAETCPADAVFVLIGRQAPLDFFRRSSLPIHGEMRGSNWVALGALLLFCIWLYNWKSGGAFSNLWVARHWFPTNLPELLAAAGGTLAVSARDPRTIIGTLAISASGPSFWYTLAYSMVIVIFGIQRIRRRRTPYVTLQTLTLMLVQVFPLFLIPELLLPQLGAHGLLPRAFADALFPVVSYGHGREYWRAYGLILAWPLDVYNIFTHQPLWWWIGIGFVQTCVLIPLGVYYFGKGAYCGWICSCGALAETLGDTHRQKMPHGPGWNRLNLAGQGLLGIALLLLVVRVIGWVLPAGNAIARVFESVLEPGYKWGVDVFLAGVLGFGLYFWFSGRVWCRFFCPLAALMHIYARFSRFAILAEKKKCISCNVCTSVCHQGIDVMSFANQGESMRDPECVRCSACIEACPTGVLQFGQVGPAGTIISVDSLAASPVRMRERP